MGHERIVRLLLHGGGGAQLDLPDRKGRTALMRACVANRDNIIQLLLDKGASAHIATRSG